jgi:hypothetical protein
MPGHQARHPSSAVKLGEKNIAITKAGQRDPARHREPDLRQDRVPGQHQRGERARQDQAGGADRRTRVPERGRRGRDHGERRDDPHGDDPPWMMHDRAAQSGEYPRAPAARLVACPVPVHFFPARHVSRLPNAGRTGPCRGERLRHDKCRARAAAPALGGPVPGT